MREKKIDKSTKFRLIYISIILMLDLFFLPWLIQLPFFLFKNVNTAIDEWLKFGLFKSVLALFSDTRLVSIYLILQLLVLAAIIGIAWNVRKFPKKNKIGNDLGGPEASGDGEHGTSRWMTEREKQLTSNVWNTQTPLNRGGVLFGTEISEKGVETMYFDGDDSHTFILGATRSGKGRKVLLPSIWEISKARESMVFGDPKGELFILTEKYLRNEGYDVIVLNLRDPLKGNQWNMLDLINKAYSQGDEPKAVSYAWSIANIMSSQIPNPSSDPMWAQGAQSVLASMVLLATMESDFSFEKHMSSAYGILAEYGQPMSDGTIPLNDYMKKLRKDHPAKAAWTTASLAFEKTRSSFFTQVSTTLRLFSDPYIANMTSKQDHSMEDIARKPTAVFLIIPDEDTTRHVLATIYIDQLYQALVKVSNDEGGRLPIRVNFLLDEFGNLPAIPDFEKKLTVAGGRGMRFTIAAQDIAQLKKLYKENAQTITGNCHNWIYLRSADNDTTKLISDLTGKYTIETESKNSNIQNKGSSFGMGLGMTGRSLLMPDEVRRWDNNYSLVLRVGQFPSKYDLPDLARYRANKDFGLSSNSNLDLAKQENTAVIKARWDSVPARNYEKVNNWLPDVYGTDDDAKKTDYEKKKKKEFTTVVVESKPTNISAEASSSLGDIFDLASKVAQDAEEEADFL